MKSLVAFTQNSEKTKLIIPTEREGFRVDHKELREVMTFNVQQGGEDNDTGSAWKFLIELGDGVQMREKMASGSLVFRPLLLGDWVSEHSVPWVHYVPVQVRITRKPSQACLISLSCSTVLVLQPDLSDLPSLMAFFERHDALAQRIADAGQAWAREHLNHVRVRDTLREALEGWSRVSFGLQGQL